MTASSIGVCPSMTIADDTPVANDAALEAAFTRCGPALFRFVVVRVGDQHLADDLMQQLWLAAVNATDRVPATELEFWLRGVARNLVRNHWRTQARRPQHIPMPDADLAAELSRRLIEEDIPDDVLSRKEARDQLLLALTALEAAHQEIVMARYFEGQSLSELAQRFKISERAIEGRLYRARQALRTALTDEGADEGR